MLKKIILLLIIVTVLSLLSTGYGLLNEKNYNSILMQHISSEVTKGCETFEDKVRALKRFAHENVHPVGGEEMRLDTVGIDKLISGIGWCDQTSRVFMQLARKQGITTRLLFLVNEAGSSPHSVAEAWDGERWVVVDASYDLEFRNEKGEMATASEIGNDMAYCPTTEKINRFALYNPCWRSQDYMNMYKRTPLYINTKKGKYCRFLDYVPGGIKRLFVKFVQEIYIFKERQRFADLHDYLYFKARNYHLIGRTGEAQALYTEIIKSDTASSLKDKARFFRAVLLKSHRRYDTSIAVLTELINNCSNKNWLAYAYGYRSHLFEILGDKKSAEEDFCEFASRHFLDAHF